MVNPSVDAIITERAKFARDVEYMKAMASDALEDQRVYDMMTEEVDDEGDEEIEDLLQELPSEPTADENDEISNILNAKDMLTFDQMIGINPEMED